MALSMQSGRSAASNGTRICRGGRARCVEVRAVAAPAQAGYKVGDWSAAKTSIQYAIHASSRLTSKVNVAFFRLMLTVFSLSTRFGHRWVTWQAVWGSICSICCTGS